MHPVHVLVARAESSWTRYDPVDHALTELPSSTDAADSARRAASELVSAGRGVLIGLVAEPGKTAAKYENPETLVWRDAGAVLGYMSVVAEALRLSFCPLGITGEPYLSAALGNDARLHGAGLAIIGRA